jgi:hypothetical protein
MLDCCLRQRQRKVIHYAATATHQSFKGFLFRPSQQRLRIDQPCTQDLRPNASHDTVQSKQRSFEKRGRICRSGSVAKGTAQAHRFSRHPAE